MFDNQKDTKECYSNYLKYNHEKHSTDFFTPFENLTHAKHNLKAIVAMPVVDAYLCLRSLQSSLFDLTFGLVNMTIGAITLDSDEMSTGAKDIIDAGNDLLSAAYYAVSALTDCLLAITHLLTHSLVTIKNAAKYAVNTVVGKECSDHDESDSSSEYRL